MSTHRETGGTGPSNLGAKGSCVKIATSCEVGNLRLVTFLFDKKTIPTIQQIQEVWFKVCKKRFIWAAAGF